MGRHGCKCGKGAAVEYDGREMRERLVAWEDAMQMGTALALWGDMGIDLAAARRIEGDVREGFPIGESLTLCPGSLHSVTLSSEAARLLRDVHSQKDARGTGLVNQATGITRFDLRVFGGLPLVGRGFGCPT